MSREFMDKRTFTTTDLAKILGKPPRFVIDWSERGLFVADVQESAGSGSKRLFSYIAVLQAALILYLKERLKLSRETLRDMIISWIEQPEMSGIRPMMLQEGAMIFFFKGDKVSMSYGPDSLEDRLKQGVWAGSTGGDLDAVIGVDMASIKSTVDSRIAQL